MHTLCLCPSHEHDAEEFIFLVLRKLRSWNADPESIAAMLDQCADTTERLDIIEICLDKLSEFRIEPDSFLFHITHGSCGGLIQYASMAKECRALLKELQLVKDGGDCSSYCRTEWAQRQSEVGD